MKRNFGVQLFICLLLDLLEEAAARKIYIGETPRMSRIHIRKEKQGSKRDEKTQNVSEKKTKKSNTLPSRRERRKEPAKKARQ